jgi:hypothetical protein
VVEGLQDFVYYAAQATARFDRYSHIIPAHLMGSECSAYARTTVPDCNANFAGGGRTASARAARGGREERERRRDRERPARDDDRRGAGDSGRGGDAPRGGEPAPSPAPSKPRLPLPQLDDLPELPDVPPLPEVPPPGGDEPAEDLLDFLLGGGR